MRPIVYAVSGQELADTVAAPWLPFVLLLLSLRLSKALNDEPAAALTTISFGSQG